MMSLENFKFCSAVSFALQQGRHEKASKKKVLSLSFFWSHRFVLVLSGQIISKVIHRQNCPWPGLLTIVSRVDYQRGGVGTEGWVNPVKTFRML